MLHSLTMQYHSECVCVCVYINNCKVTVYTQVILRRNLSHGPVESTHFLHATGWVCMYQLIELYTFHSTTGVRLSNNLPSSGKHSAAAFTRFILPITFVLKATINFIVHRTKSWNRLGMCLDLLSSDCLIGYSSITRPKSTRARHDQTDLND